MHMPVRLSPALAQSNRSGHSTQHEKHLKGVFRVSLWLAPSEFCYYKTSRVDLITQSCSLAKTVLVSHGKNHFYYNLYWKYTNC